MGCSCKGPKDPIMRQLFGFRKVVTLVHIWESIPEGPTYTTIMELGPQNQNRDGFFGAQFHR